MKKRALVLLAMVMMLVWIGLGWAAETTVDPVTVKKVIKGWNPERTGIFGEVKVQCEQFAEEIKTKIGDRRVKLIFTIPGYADPTGPSGKNDSYGLRRAYNVGQFLKSEFFKNYEVDVMSWSEGEVEDMRAVAVSCGVIPIPPPVIVIPEVKSSESLLNLPFFWYWLVGLLIVAAILWLKKLFNRKLVKEEDKELKEEYWPMNVKRLARVIRDKRFRGLAKPCPRCKNVPGRKLDSISWDRLERHYLLRKADGEEFAKQLAEELNKLTAPAQTA